ncbi:MBL fold metallo-hydrolase [Rubrolithibacter danxiaensis]|uniref:MBL fold metallo-hydrolase n=1 Tax=Rubrolithibacter danxiaensis TaxID=3390805 RepID=UPI003BF7C495
MQQVIQLSVLPFGMINSYLIKGPKKHVLVDAGVPGSEQKILKQLLEFRIKPSDIGLLIITHGHLDHFGSAKELKDILGIPVLIHEQDSAAISSGKSLADTLKPTRAYWNLLKWKLSKDAASPFEPDILLKEDDEFDLHSFGIKGKIIHTPGHTKGSLSIVLENGEAIIMDLASAGIFLGGIAFHSRMKHPPFHDDRKAVKQSILRILAMNTGKFYLGHGNPVNRKLLKKYVLTCL